MTPYWLWLYAHVPNWRGNCTYFCHIFPVTDTRIAKLQNCKDRLGLEGGQISDAQITASSEWASNHGATNARLNRVAQAGTTGAWSARTNDGNQWIQAALGRPTRVTGVLIQGRPAHRQWVTKFKVQSSDDGEEWTFVQQANGESVSFYLHVYLTNCACALFFFLLRNKIRRNEYVL